MERRANCLRATAVRKRDIRTALKGIDTALKAQRKFMQQLLGASPVEHLSGEPPEAEQI